jgi:hypothetical protein
MNTRHYAHGGAQSGAAEDRADRPGSILDALTPEQFDLMGKVSAEAVAEFMVFHQRKPDQAELRWIVHHIARAILAPNAPSYRVQ